MKAKILFILVSLFYTLMSYGQITGVVFRDFNANGLKDANEPLVAGINVTAYSSTGVCGTAVTTGTGATNYSLTGCGTGAVRIEFTIPSTGACNLSSAIDYTSGGGASYGSSVQFANGNSSNVNFAINAPEDYFLPAENPRLYLPCYINGDPANSNVAAADAFVGVNFDATGAIDHVATAGEIGSTWGVAYSKQAQKIFTSAFLKRHVGLGPLGSGGIYMIDPTTGNVTNWLNLDALGIATRGTGSYTGPGPLGPLVPFSPVIGTNAERVLGNGIDQPSYDAPAFAQIGRLSLGDLDISDDGRYLFVMNLYNKTVYRIDLVDPANPQAPTAANVSTRITSWTVPSPGCVNGQHRPFGLEFARGNLFVGLVCSGESGGVAADLEAYIYQVTNFTAGTYSTLFSIPLDYDKGWAFSYFGDPVVAEANQGWFPWTDNVDETLVQFYYLSHPQPILCDIVFDVDGSLIMSFFDRNGHQSGWNNYSPNSTNLRPTIIGGDLLRAYYNPTTCTYELESNGKEGPSSPKPATGGAGNSEGPGGGEFYFRDCFDCTAVGYHRETTQGGIAMALGSGETAVPVIDPLNYDSGGLTWYNNTTGLDTKDYELYLTGNTGTTPPSGTFSKANGLGDLEVSGSASPIEIGNRVWVDTDGDGIQDAGEAALSGVTVQLVKSGTVIATATTDATGNYYFSNGAGTSTSSAIYNITQLMPNMQYIVRIPNVQGASKQSALGTNNLTIANADATTNGDYRDSDGLLVGNNAEVTVLTADIPIAGANNHTFDFGFSTISCTLSVSCTPTPQSSCSPLNGGASVAVTGGQGAITYLWSSGETTSSISGKAAGTYTVTVTDSILAGCTATCQAVIASTTTLPTATCSKVDNTNCATPNGSASVVTDGNQILWSNGGTTATINNLTAGTYTVTVTNTTTGCTNTCQAVVADATVNPTCSITVNSQPSCATLNGGSVTVVPSPAGTYTYVWSEGSTTATVNNLTGGTYMVTVTNTTTNCTGVCTQTLDTPTGCCPTFNDTQGDQEICETTCIQYSFETDSPDPIDLVYFTSPASDPYVGGTYFRTLNPMPSGGGGYIVLLEFGLPGVPFDVAPGTYYMYGILTNTPTDPSCRPSVLSVIVVDPLPQPTLQTICTPYPDSVDLQITIPLSGQFDVNITSGNLSVNQLSCGLLDGGGDIIIPQGIVTLNGNTAYTIRLPYYAQYYVRTEDVATNCHTLNTVDAPASCCEINGVTIQSIECIDNGTPGLRTDNKLRFYAMVINTNALLSTYNVTVNGGTTITPNTNVAYGFTQFTLGPGSAGGGTTFTVTVTDSLTPGCTQTFQIIDPGTCEPATQCPTPECGSATIQVNGN
ncbi:MAG: hypothetical protein H6567_04105 [Lewinellaceae bacterium]|nr:hypothetical protein [Lewinellaceae bacterium]